MDVVKQGLGAAGAERGEAAVRGQTCHIIGTSRALVAGTVSIGSLGDKMNGGVLDPCEFRTQDSARMWLDGVEADPNGMASLAILISDTTHISCAT